MVNDRRRRLLCLLALLRRLRKKRRNCKRWWVRPIFAERHHYGDWHTLLTRMRETDEDSFFNYLRMTPAQFDLLLALLEERLRKSSWRESISPGERLALTLRYLASGDSMKTISYQFRIASNTCCVIINEVVEEIWRALVNVVFFELTEEVWRRLAEEFERKYDFPNCIGAIDGKHCVVQAFPNSGSMFYNYKGTHSIVLLAVTSANHRFIAVDIGAAGRNSDGGILRQSEFGRGLASNQLKIPPPEKLPGTEEEVPFVFVADEAFPLQEHIMRPFPGKKLGDEQIVFNYRLSRARMTVENTFGILSARWRIYRRPILGHQKLVKGVIKATVCLHNWLLKEEEAMNPGNRRYCTPQMLDTYDAQGNLIHGEWRDVVTDADGLRDLEPSMRISSNRYSRNASEIRDKFTNYFLGPGSIDRQWNRIPVHQ